jgi:hypothetical protein
VSPTTELETDLEIIVNLPVPETSKKLDLTGFMEASEFDPIPSRGRGRGRGRGPGGRGTSTARGRGAAKNLIAGRDGLATKTTSEPQSRWEPMEHIRLHSNHTSPGTLVF